ncbi:MAG: carbohydrate-binding domain-containing protein [Lachnospiraceae bacterium]|nr:carbohydrate-binding domain-containing protein [Lachnospiraceae bacterium]
MSDCLSFIFKRYKVHISFGIITLLIFLITSAQLTPVSGLSGTKIFISDENSDIEITTGGNYIISGSAEEASITVDVGDDSRVNLILNGVNITSTENAPIYIKKAASATITLVEGTDNYITDAREEGSDENITAAIYSKSDLTITGSGSLTIEAGMNDAIKSKDNLVVSSGTVSVNSVDDGIIGRDSLEIDGGDIYVNAGGDALKTSNNDDSNSGKFVMNGGNVTAIAADEGIDSVYSVEINGGDLIINASDEGIETQYMTLNDGNVDITAKDDGINISEDTESDSSENNAMPGGLSGNAALGGMGRGPGMMTASSSGNNAASVSGANVSFSVSAVNAKMPAGGGGHGGGMPGGGKPGGGGSHGGGRRGASVGISENAAEFITVSNNSDAVSDNSVSADNAMPAAGEMPGGGGMPGGGAPGGGMGGTFETIDGNLTINGGELTVNAGGDGLDSNGDIYITGGYTYVSGSTGGGDSALDYNGDCVMTGGVLLLSGSSGMAESLTADSSSITMLSASVSDSLAAGETVTIEDEEGNILYSFETAKECNYLQAAVPEFNEEESFTFNCSGGESYEAQVSSHSGF